MNNLCIFFNIAVEKPGALAWVGDKCLAPFRYLFNGKTIRIQPHGSGQEIEIHRVASFHKLGCWNYSETNVQLKSSSTSLIKTAISVALLVPGLILGAAFKGLAYLSSNVRKNHQLVKEHLTPINREIGTRSNPIKTRKELVEELEILRRSNLKNCPTNALIIHGDGALTINEDPGILHFNPMKLILEGAKIVHQPSATGRLDDAMCRTRKWQTNNICTVDTSFAKSQGVNSIDEALRVRAPRRNWTSCKRYHMVFNLPRPQAA